MKSQLPTLLSIILSQLLPYRISASHSLSTIQVTVQSNETLSLITEFNHTTKHIRAQQHAREANVTVEELIASQLVLEFDVCFPDYYCPVVGNNTNLFESTFLTNVCGQYCDQIQYHHVLQVLGVCETDHVSSHGYGCIDFGLIIQASSRSEAEDIKIELGASIVGSRNVFRNLLHRLAPEFSGDIDDPDILGYDISEKPQQTWYPAWHEGHELCSKDGEEPFYMKLDPDTYLAPTMTDCCRKHYWWNVRGCAEPEKRPCPEGYVPTDGESHGWNPLMDGEFYGSYPNIMYSGCIPVTSPGSNNRNLEVGLEEEAQRRELHHREQEHKLEALLERQKKLEKLMLPSSHRPPVHVGWKAQRLR